MSTTKQCRADAYESRVSQAERMVKRNQAVFEPGKPGDSVAVPVSLVDDCTQGSGNRHLQDCRSCWDLEWRVL